MNLSIDIHAGYKIMAMGTYVDGYNDASQNIAIKHLVSNCLVVVEEIPDRFGVVGEEKLYLVIIENRIHCHIFESNADSN